MVRGAEIAVLLGSVILVVAYVINLRAAVRAK
jgi:hypothetical protein